ncbi:MAG TPA: hydrogenase maturation protease [Ktedonobacteraceae bacterium]|nr:hydrogenase maturation protease [Ktedonobacteraceae bacterium]
MLIPFVLIGVGNEYRSDDGVGLIALRQLRTKGFPYTRYIESDGDGADLVEAWTNAETVILIDAISSEAAAGTIYRFDALTQRLPSTFSSQSTHAFGVAEAIELASVLHQLPSRLIVYAIEGKHFAAGLGLSSEVEQAMHAVVERVADEIRESLPPFCV